LKSLNIGVVGAGYISQSYHCPALKRLRQKNPRITLAAICDLDQSRARELASSFGFTSCYTDLSEMLEKETLDGAYILIDPGHIKEMALEFIGRGIPLLVEKPPGRTSGEVRELKEAAAQNRVPCLVALNRRFIPLVERTKKLLEEAGSPAQLMIGEMLRCKRTEEEFAYGTAVHAVDLMRYLGGDVKEVQVKKLSLAGNSSFSYLVDFVFKSGLLGSLSILPEVGFEAERYTVHGHDFTVRLEAPLEWTVDYPGRLLFFKGRENHFIQDNRILSEPMRDRLEITGFLGESSHFIDCLETGRTPHPSFEDCLQSVEIAEAIQAGTSRKF